MKHSSSVSGVYIISIFTPASLDIGFKVLSCLSLSLIFSIVTILWSLDYYLELTLAIMSLALSYRWVALSMRQYFLQFWWSFFALDFWWISIPLSGVIHQLLPVKFTSLVTILSFTLLHLSFVWIRRFASQMRSLSSFTIRDECTLIICNCCTHSLYFVLALMSSL